MRKFTIDNPFNIMPKNIQRLMKNKLVSFLFLAIFFVLPFERIPTVELLGFTVKISYILALLFLAVILFGGALVQVLKQIRFKSSDSLLVLFWITSFISLHWAPNLKRGLIIFALWTFVFLIYIVFSRILVRTKIRREAEDFVIYSTILVCLFGIYQFLGDSLGLSAHLTQILPQYSKAIFDFPRIQSVGLEPLYFANFLLVPTYIVANRYFNEKTIFNRYFFIEALILLNIILTVARGAYIALLFSMVLFLIYLILEKGLVNRFKKIFGFILIIVTSALISAAFILIINGQKAASNFTSHAVVQVVSTDQRDYSQLDRFETYNLALKYAKQHLVFGNGLGSFGVYATPEAKKSQGIYQTVNNEYLEILTETGIIGLLLFLSFLVMYCFEVFKNIKNLSAQKRFAMIALALGLVAVFVQYNFFSTLYIIYIWVFLALLKGEANSEEA